MIVERKSSYELAQITDKKKGKGFNPTLLKPFDPLPVLPSKYGRASAIDVARRYEINTSLNEILRDVEYVTLEPNGQFNILDKVRDGFVLDASALLPTSADYCMYQLENYMDQIYGVTFIRSKSVTFSFNKIISEILVKDRFKYLVELNVSYLALSDNALDAICTYINPISAGYCPLRRVIATRCSLGN